MTAPRSFLLNWAASLIALVVAVVALNLLVDPYDVFGIPRIAGISVLKPGPKNHALLAKTYQLARAHPVTVLIGSSPTHIGIDAQAAEWPVVMQPVYNYGIPGGYSTSTSLRTLQEAVAVGGVKNAVVFLDFQNFFVPERAGLGLSDDDRRYRTTPDGAANPRRPLQMADDMFLSLATMGALIDSVTTVIVQTDANLLNLAADGSSTESDFINAARADGMHDLFAQKDDFEVERAEGLRQVMAGWHGGLPNLGVVATMIEFAKAHGVALTLVITPHHGDALEIYWRNGMWPRIEQLKTELAAMVAAHGGGTVLWDFMDYSDFNIEAVPAAGDRRTPTSWFWEPTHFKKQLGDVMIQRMFGEDAPTFGNVLTPDTVAKQNAEIRRQRSMRICSSPRAFLLTALASPPADGCGSALDHGGRI